MKTIAAVGELNFIFQLIGCNAMFCHDLPKRDYFVLRYILTFIILSVAWGLIVFLFPREIFLWELRYIFIFGMDLLAIGFCYRVSWNKDLYIGVLAYAVQHISDRLAFLIWIGILPQIYMRISIEAFIAVFLVCLNLTIAVFLVLGYLLFARRLHLEERIGYNGPLQVCIIFFFLFAAIFINQIFGFQVAIENTVIYVLFALCDIVIMSLIIILQLNLFHFGKLENESREMKKIWDRERRQMELRQETVDMINVKCHDLKYQLSRMSSRLEPQEIEKLKGLVSLYESEFQTGNKALDLLLSDHKLLFEKEKIALTCMVDGTLLDFITDADVYSLFGNIIDNAIEALMGVEVNNRTFVLIVKEQIGRVLIHSENSFSYPVAFHQGLPITNKKDKMRHGFGTKSIALLAKKYGGTCVMAAKEGRFTVDILLRREKPKQE